MKNRLKGDGGWLLGFLAAPFGIFCIALAVLLIAVAVMI